MLRNCLLLGSLVSLVLTSCGQTCDQPPTCDQEPERVFTIAVGHDWGAHEYIDDSGYLSGFNFDVINAVCSAARIKCRTLWDKYQNCWNSEAGQHSMGGPGLLSSWYDACSGWVGTTGRLSTFDFSMPYLQPSKSFFYRKKGSRTDINDMRGLTIGFQDGYYSDEKCLAKSGGDIQGLPLGVSQVKHYATTPEMTTALANNEVDLLFIIENALAEPDTVELVPGQTGGRQCAIIGHAMMTRKDNDFNSYWNKGFQQIVSDGRYAKLCQQAKIEHGAKGDIATCV